MENTESRLYFASDYMEGAHPAIMKKLMETNLEKTELHELPRSKAIHRYSFIVITVHYVLNNVACGQYLSLY